MHARSGALDRSAGVPGTIKLLVERIRTRKRGQGVLLALTGGPGEAATPAQQEFVDELGPALADHNLVLFDARGTGESGRLDCRPLDQATSPRTVARCAASLGARRAFYTTRDAVADIEAVRQSLGVNRLAIYGISYGTKPALAYATAYPDHVERLVLDSPLLLDGPDPFARSSFAGMRRVLGSICDHGTCRGITHDVLTDVMRLAKRLRTRRLHGYLVGGNGRRPPRELAGAGPTRRDQPDRRELLVPSGGTRSRALGAQRRQGADSPHGRSGGGDPRPAGAGARQL